MKIMLNVDNLAMANLNVLTMSERGNYQIQSVPLFHPRLKTLEYYTT